MGDKMFRKSGLIIILAVFVSILLHAAAMGADSIVLDRVVAVVNSEVITWSEMYKAMEFEATPSIKALKVQERRKLFKESEGLFLENLINTKLLLQAAKAANIGATDVEVKEIIKGIMDKNALTEDTFKAVIEKEGFTLDEYKKKLAEQIIATRVVDIEVRSKIIVTDKEIDDYIKKNKEGAADEGYKIRIIVIKNSEDTAREEQKVKTAYAKIKAGTDFSEVAKQYSEDSSARAGGDLGFVKKTDISSAYIEALSKLKQGEVSEPFKAGSGTHIIKLERAMIFKTQNEFRAAVKDKIYAERFERANRSWLKGLRQNAYVEIK
jgi:peptidyl-prolyl cis-trans isomerase SurA